MKTKSEELPPIVVPAHLSANPAEEARLQLELAAAAMHTQAADKLAEGLFLEGQSVRIEQIARISADEDAVKIRDMFVSEGLIVIEAMPDVSSPGGLA